MSTIWRRRSLEVPAALLGLNIQLRPTDSFSPLAICQIQRELPHFAPMFRKSVAYASRCVALR